ncbi:MAG: RNA-binding protein [Synechococcales cyanobacterium RU_4_20]|nr:RNA-binding protein [Synechococcales cyanobacterium RU_4_20]NJR68200.1 RNA-binding protein [Synechococcales cyanobacterium CRU_2_2]
MSVRLYVGNLDKETIREEFEAVFAEAGDSVSTKLVTDRKTGKCRGFGFVTVATDEEADAVIEKYNGQAFKDSEIKIEKALPRAKGKDDEKDGEAGGVARPQAGVGGGKKPARASAGARVASSSSGTESFQPDPRWAGDLAKLKEMLASQNS